MGRFTYREIFDNPHGFGRGDFLSEKYVFPEYRQTHLSRMITGDLTHLLFTSGGIKRKYAYLKHKDEDNFNEVNTTHVSCINRVFTSDAEGWKKYHKLLFVLDTEKGKYGLWVATAEDYFNMDLTSYRTDSMKARFPDTHESRLKEILMSSSYLDSMDKAVNRVKEVKGREKLSVSTRKESERWK